MAGHNQFFKFKQFTIHQEHCAMKVGTDGVLLGAWTDTGNASAILDVGTGTGLIAIMLAQRSIAHIHAIEIEPGACRQASENAEMCPWKERISVNCTSFQDYSKSSNCRYDLIVSNPPFFQNSLKTPNDGRNLARHADMLPPDELLEGVEKLLTKQGRFCLILPYIESALLLVDAALYSLYCVRKTYVKPASNKNISRVLLELRRERSKLMETNLVIQSDDGTYTSDFAALTKDYYLFL